MPVFGSLRFERAFALAAFATVAALAPAKAGAQSTSSAPRGRIRPPVTAVAPALDPLVRRPASELVDVVQRFSADRAALLRRYDASYSTERRRRLRAFHDEWRARLRDVDFDRLGLEGRLDYILLDNRLKSELAQLAREDTLAAQMAPVVAFAESLLVLHESRRRLEPTDPPTLARRLTAVSRRIDSLRAAVERLPRDSTSASSPAARQRRIVAQRAVTFLDDLRGTSQQWQRYYAGYDPQFTWWVNEPYRKVDSSLVRYTRALRERVLGIRPGEEEPIIGDPIGTEGLKAELELAFIPYTPEELVAVAEREFAWCEAEMKKAAREMGFGDDWRAALEKVKNTYVEPGKQPDLIRDLAVEATEYVERHDLITVPALAKEVWRMEMMSPERQRVAPFFLGGETILVSYPTDAMTTEEKLMSLRGNNPHFSRAVAFHELIPGHHLQGFMTQRYNAHRQAFATPFWTEGGALYWEMLLWDMGFQRSPEDRVGALFWRSHRAARIIFSLRVHMGTMTPEQAIDFLVDRVGHERANATAEVRRSFNGSYPPLYQLAYMMGGLQFRALYQELVATKRMSVKQFHDAIYEGGNMPVELVRARLTRQSLPRDFRTQWRFAGSLPATR